MREERPQQIVMPKHFQDPEKHFAFNLQLRCMQAVSNSSLSMMLSGAMYSNFWVIRACHLVWTVYSLISLKRKGKKRPRMPLTILVVFHIRFSKKSCSSDGPNHYKK